MLTSGFLAAATAAALALGASPVPTVPCEDAAMIPGGARPSVGERIVLGRVTMPAANAVLQLAPPESPGALRFAKRGVLVRAGTAVTLQVPPAYRRVYSLEFANVRGAAVRFEACSGHWTAFAGGYLLRKPACIEVVARAAGRSARVRFGVGRRC